VVSRSTRRVGFVLAALLMAASAGRVLAGKKAKLPDPPSLSQVYVHRTGQFTFRVPESWRIGAHVNGDPDTVQAVGDGLVVRFVYRDREAGYDAFHGICLAERLVGREHDAAPAQYEYDYVEGSYGDRRALDSVFVVEYGKDVLGHRKWRQRNLTVVGGGHSICLIAFAPASVWKKSIEARGVLEAVLQNVKFQE
jgi:hypothetical protein